MTKELPVYVCHKRVRALEVQVIGSYNRDEGDDKLRRRVVLKYPGGEFLEVNVKGDLFTRYSPLPGDFYVVYEDGYTSFSPRKAFLEGYDPAPPDGNIMMEMLNDLSTTEPGTPPEQTPEWLKGLDWAYHIRRVARETYVTINSLKLQREHLRSLLRRCQPGPYAADLGGGEVLALNLTSPHQDPCGRRGGSCQCSTVDECIHNHKKVKHEETDPDPS